MTRVERLCPRLVVDGADQAIAYYTRTLGAKEIKRFGDGQGRIVHAELELGDYVIMVKDADQYDPSPDQVGGSPVVLSLEVDGADDVGSRMIDAGATVVFPIRDQDHGKRSGRFRDPYGHLWIVSEPLADLQP